MLGKKLRNNFNEPLYKVGKIIGKTRIDPNIFSFIAIIWAFFAGYFIYNRNLVLAIIFVALAAIWDALDGGLARAEKKVTNFGNYIDSIIDRYVEVIIYLGFALSGFMLESFLVITGSLLVSYTKARTAIITSIDNHDWPTIGERVDRMILLIAAMLTSMFFPTIKSIPSMSIFLYVIAIIVYMGSVDRIFYARRIIKKTK